MKPITLVHIISSLKRGGAETILTTIIKNLDKAQFKHHVIYFHDGPLRHELLAYGISLYTLSGTFFRYDPFFCMRLIKLLRTLKPDIIHSSLWAATMFGICSARVLQVPVLSSLHTVAAHEGFLRNFFSFFLLRGATHVIAASETIAHSFIKKKMIKQSSITVIRNAIDRQLFCSASKTRSSLSLQETDFVVGSVGRLVKVKNYALLLKAIAPLIHRYSNIKLVLVGSGPEYAALAQLTNYYMIKDSVEIILDQPALPYYALFDCFVQPSRYEGLSLALLEAMHHKLPCIVTGHDKRHEIISHLNSGLIIEPDNLQDLSAALELLYNNKQLRTNLGLGGALLLNNQVSLEHMVKSYTNLFTHYALL